MKILVACGIYPPDIGGPATVIADLVRELRVKSHEVTVITYGDTLANDVKDGIVRISRNAPLPKRYLNFANAVRKHITPETRVFATDVFSVGIPTRLAITGMDNIFVLRLGGEWAWEDAVTKGGLRVTLRDYWQTHAKGFRHALKICLYRWVVARAVRIISTSTLLKDIFQHIAPKSVKRIVVSSNIVSPIYTQKRGTESPHVPLRIMTVGRFEPVKNMPGLARILRTSHEQGIAVAGTFVGDGSEVAETKKILEGIPDMNLVGKKSLAEIGELLSQSDVLMLPSFSDVCPNSVVEALACGVPAIITSEHGLPKPLYGVIECDPKKPEEWIAALKKMQDPVEYEKLRSQVQPVKPEGPTLISSLLQL